MAARILAGEGRTRKLLYQQNELFARWRYGKNDRQIADDLGVTSSAVWQWRRKNGLPPNCERGRQW